MKIIVDRERLIRIGETVKGLPVQGGFDAADSWVGCVIAIDKMVRESDIYTEPEVIVREINEEASVTNE